MSFNYSAAYFSLQVLIFSLWHHIYSSNPQGIEHAAGNECYSAMILSCHKREKKTQHKKLNTFMSITAYLKIYEDYHSEWYIYTYYASIFYYNQKVAWYS